MATDVSICNSALIKLGEEPIISLTDSGKAAKLCSNRFEYCKDYVLGLHPWKAVRARAVLAPSVTTPLFGYTKKCPLPTDILRVHFVTDSSGRVVEDGWTVEGDFLLANQSAVYLLYLRKLDDLSDIPEYLAELISLYLAIDIGFSLSQNVQLREQMRDMYERALRRARGQDTMNGPQQQLTADEWVNSRIYQY